MIIRIGSLCMHRYSYTLFGQCKVTASAQMLRDNLLPINFFFFFFSVFDLHCCVGSSYGEWGLLSSFSAWASHCCDVSCCRPWALGLAGFSSCGS